MSHPRYLGRWQVSPKYQAGILLVFQATVQTRVDMVDTILMELTHNTLYPQGTQKVILKTWEGCFLFYI